MFEIRREFKYPVIKVTGDLDLSNVREFEANLEYAGKSPEKGIIVDLAEASYFDSRTIHVLIRFRQRLQINRKVMLLVRPAAASAVRLLQITGVDKLFTLCESTQDAVTAMDTATLD